MNGIQTKPEVYDGIVAHLQQRLAEKDLEIMRLREALERLAKLGNGDRYGNSEGNEIAKQALSTPTTYDDLMAWHEAQLNKLEQVGWICDKAISNGTWYPIITLDKIKNTGHINHRKVYAKKG